MDILTNLAFTSLFQKYSLWYNIYIIGKYKRRLNKSTCEAPSSQLERAQQSLLHKDRRRGQLHVKHLAVIVLAQP